MRINRATNRDQYYKDPEKKLHNQQVYDHKVLAMEQKRVQLYSKKIEITQQIKRLKRIEKAIIKWGIAVIIFSLALWAFGF